MAQGWIKLHRKILENPVVCKDTEYFAIWCYLLLKAAHHEYEVTFKGERITLKNGQLITGRKKIAEQFNIHESKVQRVLKKLENEQQIEQQTSNKKRLITIKNWDIYQAIEQQEEQQMNNKRTTTEQQLNTNKNINNIKNIENVNNHYPEAVADGAPNKAVGFYEFLELEFGRTISRSEYEALKMFEDSFTNEMIKEAISKAVINQARTVKYVTSILQNWKMKNITTLEGIKQEDERHQQKKSFKKSFKPQDRERKISEEYNKELAKIYEERLKKQGLVGVG